MNINKSFGYVLGKVTQLLSDAFNEMLAVHGIDSRDFGVLVFVGDNPSISQKAIGENMRIDRTTMVARIDQLEAKGLCRREKCETDRRSHSIALTPNGHALVAEMWPRMKENERNCLHALPPEHKETLLQMLQTL